MADKSNVYLVSACLVGVRCRYNGKSKTSPNVLEFLKDKFFVPVCPETLAGLPIPRPPADFVEDSDHIIDLEGNDITDKISRGAEETLRIAKLVAATHAVFKDKSPSCGVDFIHRKGKLVEGKGVATALLINNGIKVCSEKTLKDIE